MMGEFAFTPSVFDEGVHADVESWREQLRELGNAMFPRTAAWPVMVADLYGGSWRHIALTTATSIKEDKARRLCEGLLENIDKSLVFRPIARDDWPADDIAWGWEAIASSSIERIERIVSCKAVQNALLEEGQSVRCIDEVQGAGFWSDISSQWSQPLNIASQIQAIRKLALHAEFLCLITPHVRGVADDETDFALEMIRTALRRPAGFPSVEIEVHAEGPDEPASSTFADRLRNSVGNTTRSLQSALKTGESARLVLWPHFVDRYVIAGIHTETSGGTRVRSPRWGVALQHIARRSDAYEVKPSTTWSLITRSQLGDVFNRYCTGTVAGSLHDSLIMGR